MDDNLRHIQAEFSDFKDNARRRVSTIRLLVFVGMFIGLVSILGFSAVLLFPDDIF